MNKKTKIFIIASFLIGLIAGGIWFAGQLTLGNLTKDEPVSVERFKNYEFFASTTATSFTATSTSATSTNIIQWIDSSGRVDKGYMNIAGAKKVEVYFNRGDNNLSGEGAQANTGTTKFRLQTSFDGVTWNYFEKLVSATTTSVNDRIASTTISAATSTLTYGLDLDYHPFFALRCIVIEFDDGEHRCYATAEY